MRFRFALVAIAVLVLLSACQRTSVSEGKKGSFEQGSSTRAVPTDNSQRQEKGEQEEAAGPSPTIKPTLPENFPEDVPVYPSAEPIASRVTEGGLNIGFRTTDPLAHVVKFYEENLRANGWKVEMTEIPGGETVLRGQKGNRRCEVSIAESESMTLIGITVSTGDISLENKKPEANFLAPEACSLLPVFMVRGVRDTGPIPLETVSARTRIILR